MSKNEIIRKDNLTIGLYHNKMVDGLYGFVYNKEEPNIIHDFKVSYEKDGVRIIHTTIKLKY